MPYIKQEQREYVEDNGARDCGELNYLITTLLIKFTQDKFDVGKLQGYVKAECVEFFSNKPLKYQTVNDMIGAIVCASFEFARATQHTAKSNIQLQSAIPLLMDSLFLVADELYEEFAAPYEDEKIKENGEVYPKELLV